MDSVLRWAREQRERLTPLMLSSHFDSHGLLSPHEFVEAGDTLVAQNPAWHWASGPASRSKSFLPPGKQFLVIRNCLCSERVSTLEQGVADVLSSAPHPPAPPHHHHSAEEEDWQDVSSESLGDPADEVLVLQSLRLTELGGREEAKAADDDDDDDDDLLDPRVLVDQVSTQAVSSTLSRRYDVHLVYNNAYRVPQVFLFGYDSTGPLSHYASFQDCLSDYVKKTVTVEQHPHLATYMLSIHPCQHGNAMKGLVQEQRAHGHLITHHLYMSYFLKFVNSVVPTIQFDFTSPNSGSRA